MGFFEVLEDETVRRGVELPFHERKNRGSYFSRKKP